jgi:hypothetical protein
MCLFDSNVIFVGAQFFSLWCKPRAPRHMPSKYFRFLFKETYENLFFLNYTECEIFMKNYKHVDNISYNFIAYFLITKPVERTLFLLRLTCQDISLCVLMFDILRRD